MSILLQPLLIGFPIYYLQLNAFLTDKEIMSDDEEEERHKHFSALLSKSVSVLIIQAISITLGLCNLSSLIFINKEHILGRSYYVT